MRRRPAISLRVGRMYCPRKRSGSMPAEQARPRRTRGGILLVNSMQCELHGNDANQTQMSGSTVPTHGAFLICTAMCGSGQRTGTQHTVREHRPILRVRPSGSNRVLRGGSWYSTGTGLRSASRNSQLPQLPRLLHRLPCRFPAAVC